MEKIIENDRVKKGSITYSQGGKEHSTSCVLHTWKMKRYIALCGELAFEEAVDRSQDRLDTQQSVMFSTVYASW
jgi:hypothetical protein